MVKDLSSTLASYLERFVYIGQTRYNGKIHDNVLNIFEDLDIEDKKGLLRSLLRVHRAATTVDDTKDSPDSIISVLAREPVVEADEKSIDTVPDLEKENSPLLNTLTACSCLGFIALSAMGLSGGDDTDGYEALVNVFNTALSIFK